MSIADGLSELDTLLAIGDVIKALKQLPKGMSHLNAHEQGTLPCLCKRCVGSIAESVRVQEMDFILDGAAGADHFLLYWVPNAVASDRDEIRQCVARRLRSR